MSLLAATASNQSKSLQLLAQYPGFSKKDLTSFAVKSLSRQFSALGSARKILSISAIWLATCGLSIAATYEVKVAAPENSVSLPSGIKTLVEKYADLARFATQSDIADEEIIRLIGVAPEQIKQLIATEGFFSPQVLVTLEGTETEPSPRVIQITISLGLRTFVSEATLKAEGSIVKAADAQSRIRSIEERWKLSKGAVFRDEDWRTAKTELLASLWADRYPTARIVSSQANVDADRQRASLELSYDSGPEFKLGELQVTGLKLLPATAVANLSSIRLGDPYSQRSLLDFQDRLQASGLFRSVAVDVEPDPEKASASPIKVRVREQVPHRLLIGPGFSTDTGPRITVEHDYLKVFGFDWQAQTRLRIARDERSVSIDALSFPLPNFYRNLINFSTGNTELAGLSIDTEKLRIGRRQDSERFTRLYYLDLVRSGVRAPYEDLTGKAAVANFEVIVRNVDSVLFPTNGLTASGQLGIGIRFGESKQPFVRSTARLTYYRALSDTWLSQVRIEAGAIATKSTAGIPQNLLFRAGGENSVRGYALQTLGVDEQSTVATTTGSTANTYVRGGKFLVGGSIEIAREVIPKFYATAFTDFGGAADSMSQLKWYSSIGVGARWRSPVGPLNAYIAYANQRKRFSFGVSVGVSF